MEAIFPGVPIADLLIIPTCQNSEVDLVRTGEVIEEEKDRLLENVSRLPSSAPFETFGTLSVEDFVCGLDLNGQTVRLWLVPCPASVFFDVHPGFL